MSNNALYGLLGDGMFEGALVGPVLASPAVNVTDATLIVTRDKHAGRMVTLNRAAGQAITLPAATGTGAVYKFMVGTTITSNTTTIKVANATDSMLGRAHVIGDDAAFLGGYAVAANDDTITLNGTTQGGYLGDCITVQDVGPGLFYVHVSTKATGTEATPFSATVS